MEVYDVGGHHFPLHQSSSVVFYFAYNKITLSVRRTYYDMEYFGENILHAFLLLNNIKCEKSKSMFWE